MKLERKAYGIWKAMKNRCYNKNYLGYKDYGGRGIKVCSLWFNNSNAFIDWALSNGIKENLTLDRIDNNKDYSPSNCKWSTRKEQANNRRTNKLITFNGKTQNMKAWSEELGIPYSTLTNRICYYNWPIERALGTGVSK